MKRLVNSIVHLSDNDGQFEKLPVKTGYTRHCILEIVIPGGTDEDFRVSKTGT